jgi:uroporphyrin-III C-methyltransferase
MHPFPFALPEFAPGSVWLSGAGPGEPGLLTLLAAHGLGQADVVVYDALVDRRVLALAREGAQTVFAGKRGGKPSPTQPDICARLIRLAREGKRVLRLKGGDPFVFGRGAEEALALVAAGIPFRIVPGVTAGIGGLAYAGIPATHRETNAVVSFVTGHNVSGEVPDEVDWPALARSSPVIVLYMALAHIGQITDRLIAAGRAPDEPVAIVARATMPSQQVIETSLARAAQDALTARLEPPAIVVVGPVVRLRSALDWLGAAAGGVLCADPLGTRRLQDVS